jgi:hypothetical protein
LADSPAWFCARVACALGPRRQDSQKGEVPSRLSPCVYAQPPDSLELLLKRRWARLNTVLALWRRQLRILAEIPCSSRSVALRFRLISDRELRDSDEVEVEELDELFAGRSQLSWTIHSASSLAHLLVNESDACTSVPPVLLEGRGEVPALQPPEAANDCPRTVAAQVAHHHDRVRARVKEDIPVRRQRGNVDPRDQ